MNYLLDTHVLIWFSEDNARLPARIKALIEDDQNSIFVSHAAIWEMAIKMSLAKLKTQYSLDQWERVLHENGLTLLPTSFSHYQALLSLPFHHNDPFDRLIIAQAMAEDFTVITHDPKFTAYLLKLESF